MRDSLHLLPTGVKQEEHIRLLTKLKRRPQVTTVESSPLSAEIKTVTKSFRVPTVDELPAPIDGTLVIYNDKLYYAYKEQWFSFTATVLVPVVSQLEEGNPIENAVVCYNGFFWLRTNGQWQRIPQQIVTINPTAPSDALVGDLYYNTTDKQLYTYDGSSWLPADLRVSSGSSFPSSPLAGQLFYRTDQKRLYVYNGTGWVAQEAVQTASSDPASGVVGELYFNTTTNRLKVYNGSTWQEIGAGGGSGVSFGTSFPSSPTTGQLFYRTDQKRLYTYDGTNWVAQEAIQTVSSAPSSPVAGQMWYSTSGNLVYVYTNTTRTLAFDDNATPLQTNRTSGSAGSATGYASRRDHTHPFYMVEKRTYGSVQQAIYHDSQEGFMRFNLTYESSPTSTYYFCFPFYLQEPIAIHQKNVSSGNNDVVMGSWDINYPIPCYVFQVLSTETNKVDFSVDQYFRGVLRKTTGENNPQMYVRLYIKGQASFTYYFRVYAILYDITNGSVYTAYDDITITTNASGYGNSSAQIATTPSGTIWAIGCRIVRRRSIEADGTRPDDCKVIPVIRLRMS